MFDILFENISKKVSLDADEQELIKTFFIPKKLRKRQYLLQEGDESKYLAFVETGLLRSYTVTEKGVEHIMQFAFEGWWINDQFSFLTGEPSMYNIDAVEDCEILLLTKSAQDKMLEQIPKMEKYFRLLLQEKYLQLIKTFPTTQRVPQHMLASYMGITPETLSRFQFHLSKINLISYHISM
ncbi:Crp/Fnr family transcriptional regulator [soil metagenome]